MADQHNAGHNDSTLQGGQTAVGQQGQPLQGGQTTAGQQGQPMITFGGQPMQMMMMGQPTAMGQQGGQMMVAGNQGGQMMMGQPMMVAGNQGGQMMMGQPMMVAGNQGGQMMGQQMMVAGNQGGQMMMGQPMGMMGVPWQMQMMKPPQMQMGQPSMEQLPQMQMGQPMQMAYPQAYPPSGAVMYNSGQAGVAFMGTPPFNQPNLRYTPTSYIWLSYVTMVLFGLLCPLSLFFSVPAVVMSRKSENSTSIGDIRKGKNHGAVAVYLNFAAVVLAFIASDIILGCVLGLYIPPGYNRYYYG